LIAFVTNLIRRYPTLSFFILAYALTWSIAIPLLLSARGWVSWHVPHELEGLAAFGPLAAAFIIANRVAGREGVRNLLNSCLNWRVPGVWLVFTLLSPFAVLAFALLLAPTGEGVEASAQIRQLIFSAAFVEMIVFGGLFQGLGEEPGWRGFALPLLRRRSGPFAATLMLFPIWLCWHLPMFLSRPEFTLGSWIGFSIGILSAAIWLTFIYDATRSVLMAILWHMIINICRGVALAVSTPAFLMFGQVVAGVALLIVVYWLIARPGKYEKVSDA